MTRILCLDDDPDTLELLRLILRRGGYEVWCTTSSSEALRLLRSERIDLVTQDFLRPDMDGWAFLRLMASDESLRAIPVLGISAGPRDFRAEQARRIGFDLDRDLAGYVVKPCAPDELLAAVAEAVTKSAPPRKHGNIPF
jgi:CheY-like chemotaxis protein